MSHTMALNGTLCVGSDVDFSKLFEEYPLLKKREISGNRFEGRSPLTTGAARCAAGWPFVCPLRFVALEVRLRFVALECNSVCLSRLLRCF